MKKHKGRHIWINKLSDLPVETREIWNSNGNTIATILFGKTCTKCGKEERELKVICEYRV